MESECIIEKERRRIERTADNPLTILLIDDDVDLLQGLSRTIKQSMPNSAIILSSSGKEGVDKAQSCNPHLIILDILMPDKDGFEVYKDLMHNAYTKLIPVIMMTGAHIPDFYSRGLELGANAFLFKPITSTNLISQMRAVLKIRDEKMQLEERAVLNELRYKHLFDRASDGICILDLEGKILDVNEAECRLEGYTKEALLTMNMTDLDTPESAQKMVDRMAILLTGEPLVFEVEHRRKDGAIASIEVSASLISYGGKPAIQSFHRDVTRKKAMEEALLISETKYREMFRMLRLMCDTNPDMLWAKNMNKEFIFVNEEICKVLLIAKDTSEPIGKTDLFFAQRERDSHPDDPNWHTFGELCQDSDQIIIDTQIIGHFDETGNVQGKNIWLSVNKAPIFDNGEMVGIVGSGRDRTEHRLKDDALAASELKYRELVQHSNVIILRWNLDGTILFLNKFALEFFGYDESELIGQNVMGTIVPEVESTGRNLNPMITKILKNPKEFEKNINENIKKNGERVWISWTNTLVHEDCEVLSVGVDITDKLKAEEALAANEAKYKEQTRLLRLMCDTNPDMLWAKNMKEEFIFANEEICKVLLNAKDTEEPVGKTNRFFANREREAHPEDPNWHTFGLLCKNSDDVIIETRKPAHFEETGNVKGQYLVLSVNKAPLIDNDKMIGIVGSGRDITKSKELEQKVLKSKLKYRAILDNLQDGFIQVDHKGIICFVRVSALEILGYTSWKELNKTPVKDLVADPSFCDEILQRLQTAGGNLYDQETEIFNKHKEVLSISFNAQLVYNENKEIIGINSVFKNITESKRRLTEIIKLYQVVEGSQNGLVVIENEGTISYANNSVFEIVGIQKDEIIKEQIIGKKAKSFISFNDDLTLTSIFEIIEETNKWIGEAYIYCPCSNNGRVPIDIVFSKIIDDNENTYIVASFYNTSERRELEQKIVEQSRMYETLASDMYELTSGMAKIRQEVSESNKSLISPLINGEGAG